MARRIRALTEHELDTPETHEPPPITDATAAIGENALVVTWNLARPLDTSTTPALLTVWLPRNAAGPIQLGLEVTLDAARAFMVDFEHQVIRRSGRARTRVRDRRIIALFPLDWVRDLDPVEISHTSALTESSSIVDPAMRLHFTIGND